MYGGGAVCMAHSEEDIGRILAATEEVAEKMAASAGR
jgi:glutamate-1-semialdehyde aminotransferase